MNRHEFYDSLNKYKSNSLTHYGTLGQKWGVRKWQNYDGTFNEAGKERYFGSGKFKPVSKEEQGDKINSKVNEIYKNYKPNDYNRALNQSDLSDEEWWKIKKELNKKLYTEDKRYSKIVNDENVKNALQEYLNTVEDTHKEEERIISDDFKKNNKEAQEFDGDGYEYWNKFADPDIVKKSDETYWNLREAISKKSYKNMGMTWDSEMMDKVLSDINEIVEKEQDSDKIYDALKENTGVDFRNEDQKIGGWNLSKNNKPYYKELKSTVKELGLDKDGWDLDKKNGVLTKDFKDKDNKHNIGLFATTDKENMKKLTDKINKTYSKENIDKIFDDIREKATEKAYKKYVKDHKEWAYDYDILSREDFKKSIIIPKSIIFNNEGKSDMLYFELPYKPGTDWFIESYWTGNLDVDGNLSKLKFEWN